MRYQFTKDAPKPIDEDEYSLLVQQEFKRLLAEKESDESAFQDFFEHNPCFLPGARGEFDLAGPSGHGPHLDVLISQPKISGLATRHPDFMWFAYDSQVFSPILIEIEAPSKKHFNNDGTPSSQFTKAKNQLDEWKAVLSRPTSIHKFYEDYNLPKDLTDLYFEPYFVLIYGQRKEYANNPWLSQKRPHLIARRDKQVLMSYDRLQPQLVHRNFICCTVKNGEYHAKYLSPQFKLCILDEDLIQIKNLDKAIDKMQFASTERKDFLKLKLPDLLTFLRSPDKEGHNELVFGQTMQFDE